ncbi:hypothetical protein [uncultured Psychrobacter sp.]|uniref:hypothetical protein n=1 Tax=uncultured Psychrobacter sp. TaxID=259303 RepID=UPI0026205BEB|nr:hypothetical protein [uncultured Psychrobacter sp.]
MKKTVLNTALSAAMVVTLGLGVTACSGDKEGESHEVLAVDRVEEAAELARQNAPEAEDMEFPETAPMPVEGETAVDGTEAGATTTTEEGMTEPATAEATADDTNTDAAVADNANMPATDAETTESDAEPATTE